MQIKFGGKDERSLQFFANAPQFFVSLTEPELSEQAIKYIVKEYLAQGGRATLQMSAEQLEDLRKGTKGSLAKLTDTEIELMVNYFCARVRNYAHIARLREGMIRVARIERSAYCGEACQAFADKLLRTASAADAIKYLLSLPPTRQRAELENATLTHVTTEWLAKFTAGPILSDDFVKQYYLFPPFYAACGCSLKGIIPGTAEGDRVLASIR